MSVLNNSLDDTDMKDVRNHLIEIGIYEKGMSSQEMSDIYKIIKQSEKSANEEQEYRKTLDATNKNEVELLEVLTVNRSLRSGTKVIEKCKKVVEDNNNLSNDSFFPTHEKKDDTNGKIETSDFSDSDGDLKIDETTNKCETTQTVSNNTGIISCYSKNNKNVDVFSNNKYKPSLKLLKRTYKNEDLPFYCRPDMKAMPQHFFAQAIMKFHEQMSLDTKELQNRSGNRIFWGKPIAVPVINKSKMINKDGEIAVATTSKPTASENDTAHCLRSRRNAKRRSYTEYFFDDENYENKKIRESKSGEQENVGVNQEFDYSLVQNKIFDDLRDSPAATSLNCTYPHLISKGSGDARSSDEEPLMEIEVLAIVHNNDDASPPAKRKCTSSNNNSSKNILADADEEKSSLASGDIENIEEDTSPNIKNGPREEDKIEIMEDLNCIISSNEEEKQYPRRIQPPNPCRDKISSRTEQRIKSVTKRRHKNPHSIVKPDSQKVTEENMEESDAIFKITPKKFYGPKPINHIQTRLRSNASKTKNTSEENECLCPICGKYFSSDIIQAHASTCLSPERDKKMVKLCEHCDAVVTDIEQHDCSPSSLIFGEQKK